MPAPPSISRLTVLRASATALTFATPGLGCLLLVLATLGCAEAPEAQAPGAAGPSDPDMQQDGAAGGARDDARPDAASGASRTDAALDPRSDASAPAATVEAGADGDAARAAQPVSDAALSDAGWPPLTRAQIGKPTLIASGFLLAEGPLWDHCAQVLRFTDVDPARMHQLLPPMMISVTQEKTNYANGIAYHPSGDLLRAEMGGNGAGKITRVDAAGTLSVIADKGPTGQALHTPDDLVVRSDGTIYFTDPTFAHGPAPTDSLFDRPVYRITPESQGHRVILEDSMPSPNGVELTRAETTLLVASYLDENVYSYAVAADGALGPRKVFARAIDDADSMCLDAADNVYVGASSGLRVFRADGLALGNIPMPTGDKVTNCEFGGSDGKTLYITAWTTIWQVTGLPFAGSQWQRNKALPCP